jgi:hypothetical protein
MAVENRMSHARSGGRNVAEIVTLQPAFLTAVTKRTAADLKGSARSSKRELPGNLATHCGPLTSFAVGMVNPDHLAVVTVE